MQIGNRHRQADIAMRCDAGETPRQAQHYCAKAATWAARPARSGSSLPSNHRATNAPASGRAPEGSETAAAATTSETNREAVASNHQPTPHRIDTPERGSAKESTAWRRATPDQRSETTTRSSTWSGAKGPEPPRLPQLKEDHHSTPATDFRHSRQSRQFGEKHENAAFAASHQQLV